MNKYEFGFLSRKDPIEQKAYKEKILRFLTKLRYEYPYFTEWYNSLFSTWDVLKENREIILCLSKRDVIGIAILKHTKSENKICTLRVDPRFKGLGIGSKLIEISFDYLNDEKPIITLHANKRREFSKLLDKYGFEMADEKKLYYSLIIPEISYNGVLAGNKSPLHTVEVVALKQYINNLVKLHVNPSLIDLYIDKWFRGLASSMVFQR